MCMLPAEVDQDVALLSCFSSSTGNECPFCGLFSTTFRVSVLCLLGILLFKMACKCSAEVLSRALKHKKLIIIVPYRENMGAR